MIEETPRTKTFRLSPASPLVHLAGQHLVVRLTAPDGYSAQRSYSIASRPSDSGVVEITVERLDGGEVSAFLHDEVVAGDEIEVRGPIGGFVWRGDTPAVLVAGGSGIVPLMSMLRLARSLAASPPVRLIVSVRRPGDLYYADELSGPEVTVAYTREAPASSARAAGRLALEDVSRLVMPGAGYVCGSTGFVEHASTLLVEAGMDAALVRTERFGPTG